MIRLARSRTRLTETKKRRLYRWAADLVRQSSNYRLTEEVVCKLLHTDTLDWKRVLVAEGILAEEDDDPVPEHLPQKADRLEWDGICACLHDLPGRRPEFVKRSTRNEVRDEFAEAYLDVYHQWLALARWRSPLLVLDEAHHAKNDATRLARFFRPESAEEAALLRDKFDRMLFLTATPFQLGHHELIRILRSFAAVRWSFATAPSGNRDDFEKTLGELEEALDPNRIAARRLDRVWGKVQVADVVSGPSSEDAGENRAIAEWWRRVEAAPRDGFERQLVEAFRDCEKTKEHAQKLLRPWLIRHNRPRYLPEQPEVPRRKVLAGREIRAPRGEGVGSSGSVRGLPIDGGALLPFLMTARAQGQLAHLSGTRAFFAEGLASSFEAFHHTREARLQARELDDGLKGVCATAPWQVPTEWYESHIARLVPSRSAPRAERLSHPKVAATVERAVELWLSGEKVLVFCFYIQTARALFEHLQEELQQRIIVLAGEKLGLNPEDDAEEVRNWLARIVRRLADDESPFHRGIRALIRSRIEQPQYAVLSPYRDRLVGVLMAYFRSPSFVARYLPLDEPRVAGALARGETRREVIAAGVEALQRVVREAKDASRQTFLGRIDQFLDFAGELAERARRRLDLKRGELADEWDDPLLEYLQAVSVYARPRRMQRPDEGDVDDDEESDDEEGEEGRYRVMPLVRMVYGKTKTAVRDRLMLAFNSPLFPEILVSSSVMGEGVDLHRFCRYVIHHDLCWNPSTLEQRTGRLDRVRCKAEVCGRPLEIFEPFLAGSADEKMFRVLRDRERWFNIVMGQKFEFDEGASEALAARVPLPPELARALTFDLSCAAGPPPELRRPTGSPA